MALSFHINVLEHLSQSQHKNILVKDSDAILLKPSINNQFLLHKLANFINVSLKFSYKKILDVLRFHYLIINKQYKYNMIMKVIL